MTAAPPTQTDLKSTLEEMRASVAAEGIRGGIKGAIQKAFLGLLSVLLAILEDLRAGRLAPIAPVAEPAGDGAVGYRCAGLRRGFGVENNAARAASWWADFGGGHEAATSRPNTAGGAAGGDAGRTGKNVPADAYPPPSRCAGPSLPLKGEGKLVRPHWFRLDGGPSFAGLCRPTMGLADAAKGRFFENATRGEGVSAAISFHVENDAVATGSGSIFS